MTKVGNLDNDRLNAVMTRALEQRYSILEGKLHSKLHRFNREAIFNEMKDVSTLLKLCAHKRLLL